MARDRKRAKQRRAERERHAPSGGARRVASDTAREADAEHVPDALEHSSAASDELRAAVANGGEQAAGRSADDGPGVDGERDGDGGRASAAGAAVASAVALETRAARAEKAPRGASPRAPGRQSPPVRAVEFLRACWIELQRVQWPDRRQVVQATGVVLGFVIVAGVYLGVLDEVFSKLISAIL